MRGTLLAVIAAAGSGRPARPAYTPPRFNGSVIGQAMMQRTKSSRAALALGLRRPSALGQPGGHWRWGRRGFRRCHGPYSSRWSALLILGPPSLNEESRSQNAAGWFLGLDGIAIPQCGIDIR